MPGMPRVAPMFAVQRHGACDGQTAHGVHLPAVSRDGAVPDLLCTDPQGDVGDGGCGGERCRRCASERGRIEATQGAGAAEPDSGLARKDKPLRVQREDAHVAYLHPRLRPHNGNDRHGAGELEVQIPAVADASATGTRGVGGEILRKIE